MTTIDDSQPMDVRARFRCKQAGGDVLTSRLQEYRSRSDPFGRATQRNRWRCVDGCRL